MRELCLTELNLISGGLNSNDLKNYKPSAGVRVAGAVINGVTNRVPLKAAFVGGYKAGEWLNDNTPVQSWVSTGIDKITSKAGDNYSDGCNY